MQVEFNSEMDAEKKRELSEQLGFAETLVPYDEEKMKKALDQPEVKQVRVFRLKKGMRINIEGQGYKVVTVRPNGKITLRPA